MKKNYMKWIGACLTMLFCSMGETTVMAQAVIFPQSKQAGKAKIKEKKGEYTLSNDLLSAKFINQNGKLVLQDHLNWACFPTRKSSRSVWETVRK